MCLCVCVCECVWFSSPRCFKFHCGRHFHHFSPIQVNGADFTDSHSVSHHFRELFRIFFTRKLCVSEHCCSVPLFPSERVCVCVSIWLTADLRQAGEEARQAISSFLLHYIHHWVQKQQKNYGNQTHSAKWLTDIFHSTTMTSLQFMCVIHQFIIISTASTNFFVCVPPGINSNICFFHA